MVGAGCVNGSVDWVIANPEIDHPPTARRCKGSVDIIRRLALLGICRGAQLLNVRLGGSLYQELRSLRQRTSNRWTVLPLKSLLVEPSSQLAALLGAERVRINSLHNQGIDQLGQGLRICGRDLDGII